MKRNLLRVFLVITMALLWATTGLAADKVITWKVQGFVPSGMLYHDTLVRLAAAVKKATHGRLIFDVYPAGSLVPPFEGIKAVSDGVYQANYGYTGQWVGKIPVAPRCFVPSPAGSIPWICRCGSIRAAARNCGRKCMTHTGTK